MDRHSLQYVLMVSGRQSQLHDSNAIVNFSEQMQSVLMRGSTPRKNFLIDTTTPHGDVVITEDSAMKSINSWVTFKVTEGIQRGLHEWSVYIENQGETSDGSGLMLGIVPQNFNKFDSFISQGGGWCLSRAGKFYGNWRRQDANVPTFTYGTGDRVTFLLNYDNATMMVRVGNAYVIGEIHNLSTEVFPAISLHYRQQVVRFEYHLVCENSTTKQLDWMQRGVLASAAAFVPLTYQHVQRMPLSSYLYSEVFKDHVVERASPLGKKQSGEQDSNKILSYDSLEASRARLVTLVNAFAVVRRYTMPTGRHQFLSPHVSAEHLRQRSYDSLRRSRGGDSPLRDVGLNFWATMVFNLFSSALQSSDSNPMALSLIKSLMDFLLSMPPFSLAEASRGRSPSLFPSQSLSGIVATGFGSDPSRIFSGILQLGVGDLCGLLETPRGENKQELSPTQKALMELVVLIALQRGLVHEVLRVCRYLLRYPQQLISHLLFEWLLHHDEVLQPSLQLPDFCRAWKVCKSSDSLIPTGLNPHLPILSVAYGNMCLFVHTADGVSKWVSNSQGAESPFIMSSHTKEPKQYNAGASRSSMATVRTHFFLLTDLMNNTGVAVVVYTMALAVHKVYRLDEVGDVWPQEPRALAQLVSSEGDTFLLVYQKFRREPFTAPIDSVAVLSADPPVSKSTVLPQPCAGTGDFVEVEVCGFSFASFPTLLWTTTLGTPRASDFVLQTCLTLMKRSYIDLGPPELPLQSSGGYVTVELWMRFLDTESTSTFYQHGDKSTGGEVFLETAQLDGAFSIRGGYRHDARGSCVVSAPLPPTTNPLFLHIALVFDGQWGLYFNGEQVAWNRQGPHAFLESPRRRWTIGNGCICELAGLRVWRMSRSAREIARDYKHCLVGDEPGLLAQLFFNETGGNVAFNYVKRTDTRHAVCVGMFTHTVCEHHPLRTCSASTGFSHSSSSQSKSVHGGGNIGMTAVMPFRSPIYDWKDLTHARCSVVRGLLVIATAVGGTTAPYAAQDGRILSFFDVQSGILYSSQFYISDRDSAKCLLGCDPDGRAWEVFEMEGDTKSSIEEGSAPTMSQDKKKCIFVSILPFEREEDVLTASPGISLTPRPLSLIGACSCVTDSMSNASCETIYPLNQPTAPEWDVRRLTALHSTDPAHIRVQSPSSVSLSDEGGRCRAGPSGTSLSAQPLNYLDLSIKLFELLGKRAQVESMGEVLQLFSPLADDVGWSCVQEIKKTFQGHLRWIKGPGAPRAVALSSSSSDKILHWTLVIFLRLIRRVQGYGLHPLALGLNVRECDANSELFLTMLNGAHTALPSRSLPTSALNNTGHDSEAGRQDDNALSSSDTALKPLDDGMTLLAILHDIIFEVGAQKYSNLSQLAQQILMEGMFIFMPNVRYRAAVLRDALASISMTTGALPSSTTHAIPSKMSSMTNPEQNFSSVPLLDGIVCSFSTVSSVASLLYSDIESTKAAVSPDHEKGPRFVSPTAFKEIIATQQALMKLCVARQRSLLYGGLSEVNCAHSARSYSKPPPGSPLCASFTAQLQFLNKTERFVALQDAISSFQLLLFSALRTNTSGFGLHLDNALLQQHDDVLIPSSNTPRSRTENSDKGNVDEAFVFNEGAQQRDGANRPVSENWVRDYYEILFDFAVECLKFSKILLSGSVLLRKTHTAGDKTESSLARGNSESVLSELKLYVPEFVLHSAITAIPILLQRSDASWFLGRLHDLIPLCKDVRDEIYSLTVQKSGLEPHSTQDTPSSAAGQNIEAPQRCKEESALEALYKAVIFTTSWIATSMVFTSSTMPPLAVETKASNMDAMPLSNAPSTPMPPDTASGECVNEGTSELQEIIRNPLLSGGLGYSFCNAAHTPRSLSDLSRGNRRHRFLMDLLNSNKSHWIALQRSFDALAPRVPDRIAALIAYLAVTAVYLSNEPLQVTSSQSKESTRALIERVMRRLTPVRNELLLHHTNEQKCSTTLSDTVNEVQCRCDVLLSVTCSLDTAASDDILYIFPQNSAADAIVAFPTQPKQRWLWVRRRLRLLAIRQRADAFRNDALSLSSSIRLVSQVALSTAFRAADLINAYREREDLSTIRLQGLTQLLHLMQSQPSCMENVSFFLSGGFGHHRQLLYEESLAGCRHACIWKLRGVEYDILWHFMQHTENQLCRNGEGAAARCKPKSNRDGESERGGGGEASLPVLCAALKLAWHPRGFAFLCKYRVVEFIFRTYISIFVENPQKCMDGHLPSLREEDLVARNHRKEVCQFQKKIRQTAFASSKRSSTRGREQFTPGSMDGGDMDSLEGALVRTPHEQAKYTALDCMKHLGLECAAALQNGNLTSAEGMACNAFLAYLVQIIMVEMDSCLSYVKRCALDAQQPHDQQHCSEGGRRKKTLSLFSPELNLLLEQIEVFSSFLSTILSVFSPSYKFRDAGLCDIVAATASLFYQLVSLEALLGLQNLSDNEFRVAEPKDTEVAKDRCEEFKFITLSRLAAQIRLVGRLLAHNSPRVANKCFACSEIKELYAPYILDTSLEVRKESSQGSSFLSLFAFAVRCLSTTGLSSLSRHALLTLQQLLAHPDWAAELEGLAPIFEMDLKGHSSPPATDDPQPKVGLHCQNGRERCMNSWRLLTWVSALGGWIPLVPSEGMRVYYHEEGHSAIIEGYLIETAEGGDTVTVVPTNRACGDMRDLIKGRLLLTSARCEADAAAKGSVISAYAAEAHPSPIVWGKEVQVKRDFVLQPSPLEPEALAPYEGIAHHFIAPAITHFLSDLHDRKFLMTLNSIEVVVLGGFVHMAFQCARGHPPLFDELLDYETFLLIRRFACIQKPHVPLPMNYISDYAAHALDRFTSLLHQQGSQNNHAGVTIDSEKDDKVALSDARNPKCGGGGIPTHEGEPSSLLTYVTPEVRATLQAHQRIASLLSNSFLYYDVMSMGRLSDLSSAGLGSGTRPTFFHPDASQFQGICVIRDAISTSEFMPSRSAMDHLPWASPLEEDDAPDSEQQRHAIASPSHPDAHTSALCFCLPGVEGAPRPPDAKVVIEAAPPWARSFPLWSNAIAFEAAVLLSDHPFPELGDGVAVPPAPHDATPARRRDAGVFSILTVCAAARPSAPTPVLQLYVEKGSLKCIVNATSHLSGGAKRGVGKPRNQDDMSSLVECSLPLKSKHWNCFMHVAVIVDAQRLTLVRAGEVASVPLTLTALDALIFIFRSEGVVRQLVLGYTALLVKTLKGDADGQNEDSTSLSAGNESATANQCHHMVFITSLRMTNSTLFLKTAIKDIAEMVARDHILLNLNDSSEGNTCLFQLREGTGDTVESFCRQFRGKLSGCIRWASCPSCLSPFLVDLPDKPLIVTNRDEPFMFPHKEITAFMGALDFEGVTLVTTQLVWSLVICLSQTAVKQAMLQSLSPDYRLHVLYGQRQERVLQRQQQQGGEPCALTESNYFNPFRVFDHVQLARQLADLFCCDDEDYLPVPSANLLRDFMRYVVQYYHSSNQLDWYDKFIEETALTMKVMLGLEEEAFHMEIPLTMCATGSDNSDSPNSATTKDEAKSVLLMPLALLGGGRGRVKIVAIMSGRCEQLTIFRDRALKNALVKYPDQQGIWQDTETPLALERCMPWFYLSITPGSRLSSQTLGGPYASQLGRKFCLIVTVSSLRGVVMDVIFASLAQEIKKLAGLSASKGSSDVSKRADAASRIERSLPAFLNAGMLHYLANCGTSSQMSKDRCVRYHTHAVNILACLLDLWAVFPHLQPYDHAPLHVSLSHINVSFVKALHHHGGLLGLSTEHNNSVTSSLGIYCSCVQSLLALMFNAIRLDCLWTKRLFRQRVANGWRQILKAWGSCVTTVSSEETALCGISSESCEAETQLSVDAVSPLSASAVSRGAGGVRGMKRTMPYPLLSSFASTGVDSSENNLDAMLHTPDVRYGGHMVSMKILQPTGKSLALTSTSVSCTALGNGEWRIRRSCGQAVAVSSCGFSRGRFYFELRITETEGAVSAGVITDRSQFNKSSVEMIGAHVNSWGLDITHQCLLAEGYRTDLEERVSVSAGDILGVLMDLEQNELTFLYRGKRIAMLKMHRKQAFTSKASTTLRPVCSYYPCVSVNSCMCVVNLGAAPFVETLPLNFLPINPKLYCNSQMCLFWYAMIAVKWASKIKEGRANEGAIQQSFTPDSAFQTLRSCVREYCEGRDGPLSVDILCSAPHVCVNRHTHEIYTENHTAGPCLMHAGVAVRRGRWYYEVLTRGTIDLSVGWAVVEGNGNRAGGTGSSARVLGDDKESWVIETERMVVRHNGRVTRLRHHNWRDGDVLGCLLDCDSGTISFSVNGKPVLEVHDIEGDGLLFKNIVCPKAGLSPIVKAHYMRGTIRFLCNRRDLLYPPGKSYKPIGAEDVITDAMRTYYLSGKERPDVTKKQPFSLSRLENLTLKISKSVDLNLHNFSACGLCYALEPEASAPPTLLPTLGTSQPASRSTSFGPESEANTHCYDSALHGGAHAASPVPEDTGDNSLRGSFELLNIFSSATEVLMSFAQEMSIPHRIDGSPAYPLYIGPFRESLYRLRRYTLPYLGIRTLRHAFQETDSTSCEALRLRVNRRKALAAMQTNIPNSTSALTTHLRDSLFGQIFSLLADKDFSFFCRSRNLWTVSFYGEGADDVGGPYRESLSQLCSELMSAKLPLFMPFPGQVGDSSEQWDVFVIHPYLAPPVSTEMYRFIGRLMAGCLRGSEPLSLYLPSFVWKLLVCDTVNMDDLAQTDAATLRGLQYIENLIHLCPSSGKEAEDVDEELSAVLCPGGFVAQDGLGVEHEMVYNGRNLVVNHINAHEYVRLLSSFRLNRLVSAQLFALCEGFHQSVPLYAVASLKWFELEALVCGQKDYDPDALLDAARYENLERGDTRVVYLRQVLRGFTREQRALFARFVSGRERLPQGIQLKILPDRVNAGPGGGAAPRFTPLQNGGSASSDVGVLAFDDDRLPHASTCFYWLTLPQYSSVEVMRDKLLYAIEQCTDIDADFRVYDDEVGAQPDQPTLTRVNLEDEDEFEDFSHLL